MQIVEVNSQKGLEQILRQIKVDPYGIKIMAPKGISHLVRINRLSNICANILKQEMLSLGAEAAVSRDALTGKNKLTDCLLMGTLSQIGQLNKKLLCQPFGLKKIAVELSEAVNNYQKENFFIKLGNHNLNLGRGIGIMGVINLTPDSFSGDGFYQYCRDKARLIDFAEKLSADGADILDLGGESTRPGARPVPIKEELARTIPIIKLLAKKIKRPLSIDTAKPEVARQALDNGAKMVNDITGLRSPLMAKVIGRYKAAVVIMHMKGNPVNMQKNTDYSSLIEEIIAFFEKRIGFAQDMGIEKNKIIIDPGIGFAKTCEQNLEILRRLKEFKIFGCPILVGTSRKSFLGKILDMPAQQRLYGTLSSCVTAAHNGAKLVRVHDVYEVKQALKVYAALN